MESPPTQAVQSHKAAGKMVDLLQKPTKGRIADWKCLEEREKGKRLTECVQRERIGAIQDSTESEGLLYSDSYHILKIR